MEDSLSGGLSDVEPNVEPVWNVLLPYHSNTFVDGAPGGALLCII